jgi:hypothetical protein
MSLPFYNAWRTISSTPSEYWKDSLQALIDDQFDNASNVYTIQKKNNTTGLYEDIIVRLEVPYELKQMSTRSDDYRKILFKDNTISISIGDVYLFNDSYWLCIDGSRVETLTYSCIVQRCNNTLNLYKNNVLYQVPCIFSSDVRLTNMGLLDNQYLSQIKGERVAFISNDIVGSLVNVGDKFKIGRWNYECIFPDDLIMPGLLVLDLKLILEEQIVPIAQPEIVINGSTNVVIGATNTYEAIHYVNGRIVLTEFDFSIIADDNVPVDAYTLTIIDNTHASIKCNKYPYNLTLRAINKNDNTKYVDKVIKLTSFF